MIELGSILMIWVRLLGSDGVHLAPEDTGGFIMIDTGFKVGGLGHGGEAPGLVAAWFPIKIGPPPTAAGMQRGQRGKFDRSPRCQPPPHGWQQRAEPLRRKTICQFRRTDHIERTGAGAFTRCAPVRFEAQITVPAFAVPWRDDRPVVTVRSAHEELVDPYRDGLPGVADCGTP